MAKSKKQKTEDGSQKTDETVEETEQIKETRYFFPNATECPRCRTHDTEATSTKGNKQYRRCRRGHCRHRYCVIGIREK